MKVCNTCNKLLSFKRFYKNSHMADGRLGKCKDCSRKDQQSDKAKASTAKAQKKYRDANKKKVRESAKVYRDQNKDKIARRLKDYQEANRERILVQKKQYRADNKDKIKEYRDRYREDHLEECRGRVREWHRLNKGISNSYGAKRRATKIKATPSWSQVDLIKEVYIKARELTESTGTQFHVDHFYPLNSPLVCGLHVIENLRIIPWDENLRKSNKLIEDIV